MTSFHSWASTSWVSRGSFLFDEQGALHKFACVSHHKHGSTLSQYISRNSPADFNDEAMPRHVSDAVAFEEALLTSLESVADSMDKLARDRVIVIYHWVYAACHVHQLVSQTILLDTKHSNIQKNRQYH